MVILIGVVKCIYHWTCHGFVLALISFVILFIVFYLVLQQVIYRKELWFRF